MKLLVSFLTGEKHVVSYVMAMRTHTICISLFKILALSIDTLESISAAWHLAENHQCRHVLSGNVKNTLTWGMQLRGSLIFM